jgi:hypothetical protein
MIDKACSSGWNSSYQAVLALSQQPGQRDRRLRGAGDILLLALAR